MATLLQKIQDVARRIDRLGQYASDPDWYVVTKARGVLTLSGGGVSLRCSPREGRVWPHDLNEPTRVLDLTSEAALHELTLFYTFMLGQARRKAREEVIQELVEKRIKRITRAKTRGFKAKAKRPST